MNIKFCAAIFLVGSFAYPNLALGQGVSSETTNRILIADSSDYGGGWAVPSLDTAISIGRDAVNRAIFDQQICKGCRSTENGKPANNNSRPKPLQKSAQLDFKPSVNRRQQNLSRFVERTRANNPQGAAQMAKLFASNDVIGQINQGMATIGLKPNNVADAYALYWVSAWLGTRGRNENLPKSQMIAVRNQAANALLKVPEFTAATDAQKQELTEAMLIQAALIDVSIESAKSDPALLTQTQSAIAKGAEGFGLDLYSLILTPQGFHPAK